MSFMPIHPLGGAFTAVAEDATAFGGPRQPVIAFNVAAIAPTQELLDADRAWVRGFCDRLRPHAVNDGSYINFMTEFDDDPVRATFGATRYARLAKIKTTYDPDNVFHHNANIRPELAAG